MLTAVDIMSQPVVAVRGAATIAQAIARMKEHNVSDVLVERRHPQDAYGILTATDIAWKVVAFGKDPKQVRVYEIMSKPCIPINPDLAVEYVARLFAETGIRSAPVIRGEAIGIISVTDILTKGDFIEQPRTVHLESQLQQAIARAQSTCEEYGYTSRECSKAWHEIEDMQAEVSHQSGEYPVKTASEEFWEAHADGTPEMFYDRELTEGYAGL